MKAKRCLYCYKELADSEKDFHAACSKKFFGTTIPPKLDYNNDQMQELAREIVVKSIAITGVQAKLSLTIEKIARDPKQSRFTVVGLWGNYILKPPTNDFPNLPENEDLTMHLSEAFGIPTAQHSLIRLKSGELAYITRRFDRKKGLQETKLAMEDMCQLTETLTEDKYRSSMEKVGKHIQKFSTRPAFDVITFFETTLFCFLTGNADMHLKNFALLSPKNNVFELSPAYDMVCTKIAMPEDIEEMALTINAKKRKLKRADFDSLARSLNLQDRVTENVYKRLAKKIKEAIEWIDISFLPVAAKETYKSILTVNAEKINLH